MDAVSKGNNAGDAENISVQALDDMSNYGDNDEANYENESDESESGEEYSSTDEDEASAGNGDDGMTIDGIHDFPNVNWKSLSLEEFMKYHFVDREVAFMFYNWFARRRGFSARKCNVGKTKNEVVVRQTFVCFRNGTNKGKKEGYKREPKRIVRCECKARCRVRCNAENSRWYVTALVDEHNHPMLEERFHGMLPSHRRMDEDEIQMMNHLRDVGISAPSIYQAFSSQSGGFENVGFRTRDMYNEIGKQRRLKKKMMLMRRWHSLKGLLRLCAWHLMRNATSNIGKEGLTSEFSRCMLGDYEVGEFKNKWEKMIHKFGVEDHKWVIEMYEKRSMWATTYIRGKFFAGLRTTSRCEGFHSQLKKFVSYKNNLTEFIHHLNRCIKYVRQKEIEAGFACVNSEQILQTCFQELEKSASMLYTRNVFIIFGRILTKASNLKVVGSKQCLSSTIYSVRKHILADEEWLVMFDPRSCDLKCSCRRMESYGIPCDHIVAVMVYLDIKELPIVGSLSRFGFHDTINKVMKQTKFIKARNKSGGISDIEGDGDNRTLRDPICARTKGCSVRTTTSVGKRKEKRRCTTCKREGHNRTTCPVKKRIDHIASDSRKSSVACHEVEMADCNSEDESMEYAASESE
ncbi:Zinc finger, PMZ-type [Sesbania bispinosa]|nr:Zinc finger, PMZ-type [Sesbania bispinosa]